VADKKASSKTFSPLIVGGVLVLVVISAFAVSSRSKSAIAPTPTPQPTTAQGSQTHAGYEEPKEPANLKVIDVEKGGKLEFKEVSVKKNTVIAFKNEDSVAHAMISDNGAGGFSKTLLKPGEQLYVEQYNAPGAHTYYLESNPNEKGTIFVTE